MQQYFAKQTRTPLEKCAYAYGERWTEPAGVSLGLRGAAIDAGKALIKAAEY